MTPKPPLGLTGKSEYALKRIIRKLEGDLDSMDSQIHNSQHREGRLFLDNRTMEEALKKIKASDCGAKRGDTCSGSWAVIPGSEDCVHVVATKALAKIKKKGKKT